MRAAWAVLGLGCAALASAAEPASPAKPPTSATTEDTIAAARRDLEAIKALRGPGAAESGKGDVPRLAAPELSTPPAVMPSPTRLTNGALPKGTNGAAGANANWLVDAMARKGERAAGETTTSGQGGAPDEREADNPLAAAAKPRRESDRDRDPARRDDKSAGTPTPNPLSAYMVGWMTPQDYQLLRPGWTGAAAGSTAPERGASFLPEGVGTALARERAALSPANATASGQAPRENPFLAALGPATTPGTPQAGAAQFVTPAPMAALKAPPAATPPPPVAMPAPSTVPAFVKPLDDAKYFKPLKKF